MAKGCGNGAAVSSASLVTFTLTLLTRRQIVNNVATEEETEAEQRRRQRRPTKTKKNDPKMPATLECQAHAIPMPGPYPCSGICTADVLAAGTGDSSISRPLAAFSRFRFMRLSGFLSHLTASVAVTLATVHGPRIPAPFLCRHLDHHSLSLSPHIHTFINAWRSKLRRSRSWELRLWPMVSFWGTLSKRFAEKCNSARFAF